MTMQQLNITNGNDVRLRILLMRDGSPFRADDSTDVSCAIISLYGKRIQLPSFADQKDGSLIADIGHGTHSCGLYGIEVTGFFQGSRWRTFLPSAIVFTNATKKGTTDGSASPYPADAYDVTAEVTIYRNDVREWFESVKNGIDEWRNGLIRQIDAELARLQGAIDSTESAVSDIETLRTEAIEAIDTAVRDMRTSITSTLEGTKTDALAIIEQHARGIDEAKQAVMNGLSAVEEAKQAVISGLSGVDDAKNEALMAADSTWKKVVECPSQGQVTIQANRLCRCGTLTGDMEFTLAPPDREDRENEYKVVFTTGDTVPSVTFNGVSFSPAVGIAAKTRYEVCVIDGYGIIYGWEAKP